MWDNIKQSIIHEEKTDKTEKDTDILTVIFVNFLNPLSVTGRTNICTNKYQPTRSNSSKHPQVKQKLHEDLENIFY